MRKRCGPTPSSRTGRSAAASSIRPGSLTEDQKLPYGEVHGAVTPPQIQATPVNSNALPYTLVSVSAPKGATYQVGDSLLSW